MDQHPRAPRVASATSSIQTACGDIYVTICYAPDGKPVKIFIRFGKAGGCGSAMADGFARLCNAAFNLDVPLHEVINSLEGQSCYRSTDANCLNMIAGVLKSGRES